MIGVGLEVVVFLRRLVYLSRIQVGWESYLNDWKEDMNLCLLLIRAGVLLIGTAGVELVGLPSPTVAASSGGEGRQTPPPATLFRSRSGHQHSSNLLVFVINQGGQ